MIREIAKILRVTGGGFRFWVLLILRSPISMGMTVLHAVFLQNAFDAVGQNDVNRLKFACLAFGAASVSLFVYNGTVWSTYAPFVTRIEGRLRVALCKQISRFSCAQIEASAYGEWITRLNADVQMPFSQPLHLPHAFNALVQIVLSAAVLWHMDRAIFGWVMLFIIPNIAVSYYMVARVMPPLNRKALEVAAENTGELATLITCADIAALYGGDSFFLKRFEQSSLRIRKTKMKIHKRNALNAGLLQLFGMGGYFVLLAASGTWIARGDMTFGGLTAAFQYRGGVLTGAMMLINCIVSIQVSMVGIRRINETLSVRTEETYE